MEPPKQMTQPEGQDSGETKRPLSTEAQMVMRVGDKAVVVMPIEEYKRITHPFSALSQFLLASPLLGAELAIDRSTDPGREAKLAE
jgi:hypothetical protein